MIIVNGWGNGREGSDEGVGARLGRRRLTGSRRAGVRRSAPSVLEQGLRDLATSSATASPGLSGINRWTTTCLMIVMQAQVEQLFTETRTGLRAMTGD